MRFLRGARNRGGDTSGCGRRHASQYHATQVCRLSNFVQYVQICTVPLFSVERQQAPYNSWYYSGFLAVAQYFPQRLVDFHSAAIVVDESLLPESVHKQIDSRARGPDHLRQHFVTEAGNLRTFSAVLV